MNGNEEISTKFIQAFLELRVENKGIRFLLESSPFGIALIDHNKRYISVNHNFANSIGYTIEEAEGLSYEELTCPLFFEIDDSNYHSMVSGDIDSYNVTKQYFKKNGEALDVRVDVFSYHSGDAETIGFLGFYQISPPFYRDYLPKVHPELERLVKISNSPGFILFKEDGRIMFGSRTAAKRLGYSEKELVTLALGAILDPVQAVKLLLIPKRMAAGKFFESELTFYHKEHSYIHIRSQFFVDDTNWFKSGRMLLIVFKNESRGEMISRPGAHEGWEKELLNEIRRVSHSLQSLHKQEPEHSFAPDIDLSDYRLTGREREVLALMLERKTTKEIAFDLGLAEITIRKHLTSLYRKFGVFGREELLLLLFGKNVE